MQNQSNGELAPVIVTVSIDEKPGLQAIANTAPDLPPIPGNMPPQRVTTNTSGWEPARFWPRWISTTAVIGRVERCHRSREFIAPLKDLDGHYPAACTIRLILDNHSAHLSKEMRGFLATRTNRFKYVLTPTHGSWLNIVETLFGKMARTFLRYIRVQSWEEQLLRNAD